MGNTRTALEKLTTALEQVGIDSTVDPPRVHPPGAWVSARRLQDPTFRLARRLVADVYLIARDTGIPAALDVLDDMLDNALQLFDREHDFEVDAVALDEVVTLPHGGGPLPAYRITIIID